jgi:GrpB-like predicted nucleotidyltransferase (UPF0157 family)
MTKVTSIIIAPYDPQWPVLFEREKQLLIEALNKWPIIIEHIGSTAVTGLAAKPVIDIMIGIELLDMANHEFIAALVHLGYEYVPEYEKEIPDRRYFRKNSQEGVRTHQIHVAQQASEFWQRQLAFRDYLRTHPETAQQYAELKRHLAGMYIDTQEYARAKSNFIQKILHKNQNPTRIS